MFLKKFKQINFSQSLRAPLFFVLFALYAQESHGDFVLPTPTTEYVSQKLKHNNLDYSFSIVSQESEDGLVYYYMNVMKGKEVIFKTNAEDSPNEAFGLLVQEWPKVLKVDPSLKNDASIKQQICTAIAQKKIDAEEGTSIASKIASYGKKVKSKGNLGYFSCEKTAYIKLGVAIDDKASIIDPKVEN